MMLLVYEVFVFPYVDIFVADDLPQAFARFAKIYCPAIFTLVFLVDLGLISWRAVNKRGLENATPAELIQFYLSSPWALVDLLGALPWDLLSPAFHWLRLLRVGRARTVIPLMTSAWRRVVPTSTGYGMTVGLVPLVIASVMHLTACMMGALARYAEDDAP